jgi:hypothetical protein
VIKENAMKIHGNKILAVSISLFLFLVMFFAGSLNIGAGWNLLATFVIYLPLSNYLAKAITRVDVARTLFA